MNLMCAFSVVSTLHDCSFCLVNEPERFASPTVSLSIIIDNITVVVSLYNAFPSLGLSCTSTT